MKISNNVLQEIKDRIEDMFIEYQPQMEEAYLVSGDDPLSIAIGIKITSDDGKLKIVTSINFIKDRCKDSATSYVDEDQGNLFLEEDKS